VSGRLDGKIALITGAGSGIGAAMAERFAAEGAQVIAADISGAEADVAARIGSAATALHCDVADPSSVEAMYAEIASRFGRLDVLANNAGMTGPVGRTHEYSVEDWDRVMNLNVRGAFTVLRGALAMMLAGGGGAVVNTASISSFVFAPGSAAYPPSKGAMLMMTKQAALEYVRDNIRVNAICPGITKTPILDGAPVGDDVLAQSVPMRRLGTSEEIAALALFLASDEAGFITGQAFVADGGHTAM
jgi:NAD(P)-dependent dehydrogenase (short-subunit alcohol dehydrogenase family)